MILTIMPGPDNLFVLAQSITQDKKQVLPHHLDCVQDYLFILVQRVLGISAIIYQSTIILASSNLQGGVFIISSLQSFRAKGDPLRCNSKIRKPILNYIKRNINEYFKS